MICFGCWPLVAKITCIKSGFHDVYALFHNVVHSVHARCLIKCLLSIFSLVWTPMSTKLWGFSCFLIRNMFGSLVMYLTHLAPYVHFPCIAHSHLLHAPLLPLSCISLYLVSSSQYIMFTLYFVALCFVIGLSFIFSFISHPSCIISIVHSLISCHRFSLTRCLFLTKRGRVYSREYTKEFFVISI